MTNVNERQEEDRQRRAQGEPSASDEIIEIHVINEQQHVNPPSSASHEHPRGTDFQQSMGMDLRPASLFGTPMEGVPCHSNHSQSLNFPVLNGFGTMPNSSSEAKPLMASERLNPAALKRKICRILDEAIEILDPNDLKD